nr:hypothetical protein [Tanacetum cinerariifolium]
YESDKIILDTYGETVTLKRRRNDDAEKDEEPSAGPDQGSKRRREGKEPESASALTETATRSASRSTQGSRSWQASRSNGVEDIGLNVEREEGLNEEEEEEEDELYRDVNINQGRGIQATLEVEDTHVTLNPTPTSVAPLPITTSIMTTSTIATTTTTSQAPILPTTIPSDIIQNLPSFGLLFRFDDRLRSLEENFSEVMQTNQFAIAVSAILGTIQHYMDQRMNKAVKVAIQIQSDRLRDEAQRENDEFLITVDENIKKIIKENIGMLLLNMSGSPFKIAFLELIKLIIVSSYRNPIQVLVAMPLYNLEFCDNNNSSLGIHIASRLPVNSKTVKLLTFTPLMGDSPEGIFVIAYWFINPHSPRHQVFYPPDMPVICYLCLRDRSVYLWLEAPPRRYSRLLPNYGHIKWIEDLVPREMWIQQLIEYNKHALWGVSHWWRKHKQLYGYAVNRESALDVYSKRRIIAITELQIVEWHDYKHLDWILLSNLTVEERFAFNVSLRMFTRSIVIKRRVEDLQLGVESYQKRLNLTKPDTYRPDLKRREANRLMRIDELHKFSDGTLNDVRNALDDCLKGIRIRIYS